MDNLSYELGKKYSEFYKSFNCNHMILFAGKGLKENELEGLISDLPWSCVITTQTNAHFSSYFCNKERTPLEYCDPIEIPSRPLNRLKLPILRLFGVDNQSDKTAEENDNFLLSLGFETKSAENRANKMLALLPGMLDCINQLVVVGYSPEISGELSMHQFAEILVKAIPDGNVQFWGVKEGNEEWRRLEKVAERQHFKWYKDSLAEILKYNKSQYAEKETHFNGIFEKGDLYYKGDIPIGIDSGKLLRFQHMATLLTEHTVHAIRPYGKTQQAKWFYNFLTLSSTDGPQWYGYLPNSEFYVKRDFEDDLVLLVRKMLEGNKLVNNKKGHYPVILEGAPGSSKSITLGALAYRIYNDHKNPVIFISNENLLFSSGSPELNDIDDLMQIIEQDDGANARILIIWDSSSYRAVSSNAKRLVKHLEDRGRRFVLVCSAYSDTEYETMNIDNYFRWEQNDKLIECKEETDYSFYERGGCYYIQAKRDLSSRENVMLWNKFKEYAGIESNKLNYWKNKLENNDNDIFMYFYRLVSLIRPNLENGLSREQRKVSMYVTVQLDDILKQSKENKQAFSMVQAFLKAGIDLNKLGLDSNGLEDDTENLDFALDRFNLCIALFSRFKIETPYNLAINMMFKDKENLNETLYSTDSRGLYKVLTTTIPWLRYGESKNGNDFTFQFRTALEAEIFLANKQINGGQQVELVCDMLTIYGDLYKEYGCIDENLTYNLQLLLRLMGPNSHFPPFLENGIQFSRHKEILQNLEKIISKLEELRTVYAVPDTDAGFASIFVTFTREYYGKLWDPLHDYSKMEDVDPWVVDAENYSPEKYAFRLLKISAAMEFAASYVEQLGNELNEQNYWHNKRRISEQKGSLTVEIALCNHLLEQLQEKYKECCEKVKVNQDNNWIYLKRYILSYTDIFQRLVPVINYDQTNGYAYNALFAAFESMYEKSEISEEQKLQYLSEIKQIADNCNYVEIVNRGMNGKDEISDHLQRIKQFSDRHIITIDDIHNRKAPHSFYELYDRMLSMNNPAAITFVCQQELEKAGIFLRNSLKLDDYQLKTCEKVRRFMREEQNMECITNSPYALSVLLRVSWMSYNGYPLTSNIECQLTRLTKEQWSDIERIGSDYCECAGQNRQPIIVLIFALAALQTTDSYPEAIKIIETLSEDQFYYNSARMRVPYMICGEDGQPQKYSGTVISMQNYKGFIRISGIPEHLGNKKGVRFHINNLGKFGSKLSENRVLKELELGIGFTGLAVYTEEGRKARGERL